MTAPTTGWRYRIRGRVQGVGFRPAVWRLARELRGSVWNDAEGVCVELWGAPERVEAVARALVEQAPPAARIDSVERSPLSGPAPASFTIGASREEGRAEPSIPPDLATCPECLAEVMNPQNRRHGYAFTNCTQCGPRFSITRSLPYDRSTTTMAAFPLCADCRAEYEDPANRRFHAEPNACPRCGPRLRLVLPGGDPGGDALLEAARRLLAGEIVAVKGLGGVHLAVDATDPAAVRRLRERKGRDQKPLAVLVADLEMARALAEIGPEAEALLTGPERPIVLLPALPRWRLAPEVAPGIRRVGLMLPYTPLHHLLVRAVARPLVLTSANRSGAPIVVRDDDAIALVGELADSLLLHDREIVARADDSVATVVAGAPMVLRRSRGMVPGSLRLPTPVAVPTLAVGAHMNNAVCLARGQQAWLGPHVGDLNSLDAYEALEEAVAHLERLTGIEPERVVHDLHPHYLSTRYALSRGQPALAVQHHHAHIAAVLAERGLRGPVIGLAYDGTGLGTDGAAWGGEIFVGPPFVRAVTWRALPLVGGDRAMSEVWRLALAALHVADCMDDLHAWSVFSSVPRASLDGVVRLLEGGRLATPAHGIGRLFDALGALCLGMPRSAFEGQVPMACEARAHPAPAVGYDCPMDQGRTPWVIDSRPLIRGVVADLRAGVGPDRVLARVHDSVVQASLRAVWALRRAHGAVLPVVASGGCFQNARLVEGLVAALPDLWLPRAVPPGDGGLCLGQIHLSAGAP